MKFIELTFTDFPGEDSTFVSVDKIVSFTNGSGDQKEDETIIRIIGFDETLRVKQSPYEILHLISQS